MSRTNQRPVSLAKIANSLRKSLVEGKKQTAVVCSTVTAAKPGDELGLPKGMQVAALRFTKHAEDQIVSRGGRCLKIDEFLNESPVGQNSMLLSGRITKRKAVKYFGKPAGAKRSNTKQRVFNKKRERARNKMFRSK